MAPAAAISSLHTVLISAPSFHKKTLRAPLSNKRVCAAPNFSSVSVAGTCSVFKGPIPTIGSTSKSQAGARQDSGEAISGGLREMDIETVCPGSNGTLVTSCMY